MDEWKALDLSLKSTKSIRPKSGWVPDEITAIRIAEATAIAQWGEMRIAKERPFRARLQGDIWTVHGTLHPQRGLRWYGSGPTEQDQRCRRAGGPPRVTRLGQVNWGGFR